MATGCIFPPMTDILLVAGTAIAVFLWVYGVVKLIGTLCDR